MSSFRFVQTLLGSNGKVIKVAEVPLMVVCGTPLSAHDGACATYLRIAADMIENGHRFDVAARFEYGLLAFQRCDGDEGVEAILLYRHDSDTIYIDFAWVSPSMRRLGVLKSLVEVLTVPAMQGVKVMLDPMRQDEGYEAVAKALGFQPVRQVFQFKPFGG